MAGANQTELKKEKREQKMIRFTNVRKAYVPGEEVRLELEVDERYQVSVNDWVVLNRFPSRRLRGPYMWKLLMKPNNNVYTLTIKLPNLNGNSKSNKYQLMYQSSRGKVIGYSKIFKINRIVEMGPPQQTPTLVTTEAWDQVLRRMQPVKKSLFEMPDLLPVKLWDVNSFQNPIISEGQGPQTNDEGSSSMVAEFQQHKPVSTGSSSNKGRTCHDPIMQAVASVAALIRHFEDLHQNTNTWKLMVEPRDRNHGANGNEKEESHSNEEEQEETTYRQSDVGLMNEVLMRYVDGCMANIHLGSSSTSHSPAARLQQETENNNSWHARLAAHGQVAERHIQSLDSRLSSLESQFDEQQQLLRRRLQTQHWQEQVRRFSRSAEQRRLDEVHTLVAGLVVALVNKIEQQERQICQLMELLEWQERGQTQMEEKQESGSHLRYPQKATSFAAPGRDKQRATSTSTSADSWGSASSSAQEITRKSSDRKQSWLELLGRLISPPSMTTPITWKKSLSKGSVSNGGSILDATKKLLEEKSDSTLDSAGSSSVSSDSLREALRQLFGSDSSLCKKKSGFPATPCNSLDMTPSEGHLMERRSSHSSSSDSLREALLRLFSSSSDNVKKTESASTRTSTSSLHSAMRNLFRTSSCDAKTGNDTMLDISSESLASVLHQLFKDESRNSMNSKSSSSESVELGPLFDFDSLISSGGLNCNETLAQDTCAAETARAAESSDASPISAVAYRARQHKRGKKKLVGLPGCALIPVQKYKHLWRARRCCNKNRNRKPTIRCSETVTRND